MARLLAGKAITEELHARCKECSASDQVCCTWHIVGHGLCDAPLLAELKRIVSSTGDVRHAFRVVEPSPEHAVSVLKEMFQKELKARVSVDLWRGTAAQYLLRLRRRWIEIKPPA